MPLGQLEIDFRHLLEVESVLFHEGQLIDSALDLVQTVQAFRGQHLASVTQHGGQVLLVLVLGVAACPFPLTTNRKQRQDAAATGRLKVCRYEAREMFGSVDS